MIDNKKLIKLSLVVAIVSSIIAYFIKPKYAVSIIAGQLSFQIYYGLLSFYYNVVLENDNEAGGLQAALGFGSKLIRILILAIPYLLAGFIPRMFDFLAVFYGQLIFKAILFICAMLQAVNNRKEKG